MQKRSDHSGYKGTPELWRDALMCWQEELSSEISGNKFLFDSYDGRAEVAMLRNKYPNLPPSYLDFIEAGGPYLRSLASGDVDGVNMGFPSFLKPDEVGFYNTFGSNYIEWKEIADMYLPDVPDSEYFNYTESSLNFNASEFDETFLVGQEGSDQWGGIYLINPLHVSTDGEWEGWFWYPARTGGAVRFRSFAHLVAQKYTYDRHMLYGTKEWILHFDNVDWAASCLGNILEKNWTPGL